MALASLKADPEFMEWREIKDADVEDPEQDENIEKRKIQPT